MFSANWERLIFCSPHVHQDLFDYLRENKYNLFSKRRYEEDSGASAEQTLLDMFTTFREHKKFSTRCSFPVVRKEKWIDRFREFAEDCFIGEERTGDFI